MAESILIYNLVFLLGYLVLRPLLSILHELAHAVLIRRFVPESKVRMYFGQAMNGQPKYRRQWGRLIMFPSPAMLISRRSLTDFDHPLDSRQHFWVTIAGPLLSLLLAGGFAAGLLIWPVPGLLKPVFILGLILSVLDLFYSLAWQFEPVALSSKQMHYNDGEALVRHFRYGKGMGAYLQAAWHFEKDDYDTAARFFRELIDAGVRQREIYEDLLYARISLREWEQARAVHEEFASRHKDDALTLANRGHVEWKLGNKITARTTLDKALKIAPGNAIARNFRGYLHLLAGNYDLAMEDFNASIRADARYPYPRNNRAWLYLEMGEPEKAKTDIDAALEADPLIADAWLNLSRYYELQGDAAQAAAQAAVHRHTAALLSGNIPGNEPQS